MLVEVLTKMLEKATGFKNPRVDFATDEQFGDYSSNIAMILAKELMKNPKIVAKEIKEKIIEYKDAKILEKVEVAGPGFINFWLKNDILINNLITIDRDKENYGKTTHPKVKTAIVEYSSANIAKPFTVGHLRSTIIGDAIANLLEFTGWKVLRDNHLGDWGTQFGKQIYAIKTWGKKEKDAEYTVKELVDLYVKFHEEAEKDPTLEDKGREWFRKLEQGNTEAREIWQKCVDWSFEEFDRIYKILGVKFSSEFENGRGLGESYFEGRIPAIIDELTRKKLLKSGELGAKLVFFENDIYPPAMILKKDGTTLYHTRDLATDKFRLDKYNPDLVINEVGSEQTLYFRQLFEIEKMLNWYKESQRVHVGHGLIRFKEGKMSTRKGNVIWMEDLLTQAVDKAKLLGSEDVNTAKKVAMGALKYNDLKRDPNTEIIFDWNEILNMEGNSGPYLQYTYARTRSVLTKSKIKKLTIESKNIGELAPEEIAVLRKLAQFSEVIVNAAKSYSPNILATYLYELASKFNTFYNKHKIIGGENEEFKLLLTKGTGQVIKNGLNLLGIEAPEKM